MSKLIVMAPHPVVAIAATRGDGIANLLTADPREVWADSDVGTAAVLSVDLGEVRPVDTIFLGHAIPLAAGASWRLRGGVAGYLETTIADTGPMRVVDPAGSIPERSHALWQGAAIDLRYLQIEVTQPAGQAPMAIGTLMIGRAFAAAYNQEWNAGRRVIDTGRATAMTSGGFAIAEGVRKGSYAWSFGDLSVAETDTLYDIQLAVGETSPVLVVEDPARTTGQYHRIHYGRFAGLKPFKRRNPAQTRWELEVEQWG